MRATRRISSGNAAVVLVTAGVAAVSTAPAHAATTDYVGNGANMTSAMYPAR